MPGLMNAVTRLFIAVSLLALAPPCTGRAVVNVSTAEEFVQAVNGFASSGVDTEVRLQQNVTLLGVQAQGWPIKNLTRGTLRVVPHPEVTRANVPVFLDGGMQTTPMTDPFTGALLEVSRYVYAEEVHK